MADEGWVKEAMTQPNYPSCPECGSIVECWAHIGRCWCMKIKIDEKLLNELKKKHAEKCLCASCLSSIETEE